MKMLFALGAAVVLVGATFVVSDIRVASADNEPAAITLKDKEHPVGCMAFGLQTNTGIHTVATPSGNTKLICHFTVPEAQRPKTMDRRSGFLCGIYLPTGNKYTNDSYFQSTPGGQAKLECTVKL